MKQPETIIMGETAFQVAVRKARYGHRDWIVWKDKDKQTYAAPMNMKSLKIAMLTHGTNDDFWLIHKNCGTMSYVCWAMAVNIRYQMKLGYWYSG